MFLRTLFLVGMLCVASIANADSLACLESDSGTSAIMISDDGTESSVNVSKLKKQVAKSSKKISSKLKGLKKKVRVQGKAKKRAKKNRKDKVQKKIDKSKCQQRTKQREFLAKRAQKGFLKDCANGNPTKGFLHILEVDSFTLGLGETRTVQTDTLIRAAQTVTIAGILQAADDGEGHSIRIEAQGDVSVTGTIQAGNGSNAKSGGSVEISSASGNVTFGSSSVVNAGNGGSGEAVGSTICSTSDVSSARSFRIASIKLAEQDGAGASGGNVIIKAKSGTASLESGAKVHVGNGGSGADMTFGLSNLNQPEQFPNRGGNSGALFIDGSSVTGVDFTDTDVNGVTERAFKNLDSFMTGGVGGAAGSVSVPSAEISAATTSEANLEDIEFPMTQVTKRGAPGGSGFAEAASGQDVDLLFLFEKKPASAGKDGASVSAISGDGGDCVTFDDSSEALVALAFACSPGFAGAAFAVGQDGGDGKDPKQNGGEGGLAFAQSGCPGIQRIGGLVGTVGGAQNVLARGGDGGRGGGTCPKKVVTRGGNGGAGGKAVAVSVPTGLCRTKYLGAGLNSDQIAATGASFTEANGGAGGDAGDGRVVRGTVGAGGTAQAVGPTSGNIDETPGPKGADGRNCGRDFVPDLSDITGTYNLSGTRIRKSGSCTSFGDTISNDSVPITTSGDQVIFNSTGNVQSSLRKSGGFRGSTVITPSPTKETASLQEALDGFFRSVDEIPVFQGTLTFRGLTDELNRLCSDVYEVQYTKNSE